MWRRSRKNRKKKEEENKGRKTLEYKEGKKARQKARGKERIRAQKDLAEGKHCRTVPQDYAAPLPLVRQIPVRCFCVSAFFLNMGESEGGCLVIWQIAFLVLGSSCHVFHLILAGCGWSVVSVATFLGYFHQPPVLPALLRFSFAGVFPQVAPAPMSSCARWLPEVPVVPCDVLTRGQQLTKVPHELDVRSQ